MAGMFELFIDEAACFRFRLTAPDGTVMALSRPFPDKAAAVTGIAAVREYAGTGFVTELAEPPAARRKPHQDGPVPPPLGPLPPMRRARAGWCRVQVRLPHVRIPSLETPPWRI
ncbi:MAG: hypothetical protein JWO49_1985 [Arthrobacter sp.]|nr:hypothetical protein [Arthrobacter sp.]